MSRLLLLTITASLALLLGCDAKIEQFDKNDVFALTVARTRGAEIEAARDDTAVVLEELFGTPNEPNWPSEFLADPQLDGLVDLQNLRRAAGPVSSDRDGTNFGLFRKHCVTCHGLSGSGAGPAALFQNPYPRDLRHGVFKWKSTARAAKPTREDLRSLLRRGVPGTAMPSFELVPEEDVEALVDYVVYLSARGEVERRLIAAAVDELGYDRRRPSETEWQLISLIEKQGPEASEPPTDDRQSASEAAGLVREIVERVVRSWAEAPQQVVAVDPPTELTATEQFESVERGRGLFHGQIANCVGCHGPGGNGEAITVDYDDWSKEYSTRLGITPEDREAMRPFREAGALPPRRTEPRKLTDGLFRGGGDGETLMRRISQGIAGTPMPALEITDSPAGIGLTPSEAWDLVRYVQSLK